MAIQKKLEIAKVEKELLLAYQVGNDLDSLVDSLQNDGVYRILLDNFDYEDTRKAVKLIGDKCLTES